MNVLDFINNLRDEGQPTGGAAGYYDYQGNFQPAEPGVEDKTFETVAALSALGKAGQAVKGLGQAVKNNMPQLTNLLKYGQYSKLPPAGPEILRPLNIPQVKGTPFLDQSLKYRLGGM